MNKRRLALIASMVMCLCLSHVELTRAHYLFLKDGKILEGEILSEGAKTTKIKLPSGETQEISNKEIIRKHYKKMLLQRRFVRKTDGTSFEAYLVYENNREYTFRKDLGKREEFSVPRDEVLFMSMDNPTNLTAFPGKTFIQLKWKPPYVPARLYNIYVKRFKRDAFKLVGKTADTEYKFSKLKTKEKYYFVVKAINSEGKESIPSNEVEVVSMGMN